MPKQFPQRDAQVSDRPGLEEYLIQTGFYDLLPIALQLAGNLGYDQSVSNNLPSLISPQEMD
ncbi:MAG: hypothetical protein QMC95_10770 [Desulfitobacteriaceae bacterium]|nr:hypothetical protein [Desulfitobacteriaceae bacterium]